MSANFRWSACVCVGLTLAWSAAAHGDEPTHREPQSRLVSYQVAWADDAPQPTKKPLETRIIESDKLGPGPTGPYKVVIEQDGAFPMSTIFRPEKLGEIKHPIIVWGEGGCIKNGMMFAKFLRELASYGIVIVADGPPGEVGVTRAAPMPEGYTPTPAPAAAAGAPRGRGSMGNGGVDLIRALDWIFAQNEDPKSKYYQKLNTKRVAAAGQSCGGLMAYGAAKDPRVTTVGIWNSGLFARDQAIYDSLHTPLLFITGGPSDVAYPNLQADFEAIKRNDIPIFYGDLPVGHRGTYGQDNAGEFGVVGIAWVKWQLLDDEGDKGKGMFVGENFKLKDRPEWTFKKKNLP